MLKILANVSRFKNKSKVVVLSNLDSDVRRLLSVEDVLRTHLIINGVLCSVFFDKIFESKNYEPTIAVVNDEGDFLGVLAGPCLILKYNADIDDSVALDPSDVSKIMSVAESASCRLDDGRECKMILAKLM